MLFTFVYNLSFEIFEVYIWYFKSYFFVDVSYNRRYDTLIKQVA